MPGSSRSRWLVIAGVLLLIDGIGSLLLSGILLFLSIVPPVAAIEGRPPPDQNLFGPGFAVLGFSIACFWVGRRVLAREPSSRPAGIVLAGVVAGGLASVALTGASLDAAEVGLLSVLMFVQVLIVVGLSRWSGPIRARG